MSRNAIRFLPFRLTVLTTLLLFGSCVAESGPTAPEVDRQTMEARGGNGGGGGGGGGSITVTGTEPGALPRGAKAVGLTVRGSGFEAGSELTFEVDGVESGSITVLGVSVVDETTMIATVDVDEDAPEDLYDVGVRNGPKKKGVGIDLLAIVPEVAIPVVAGTPAPLAVDKLDMFSAAGGRVVGYSFQTCGWVYDVASQSTTCISVPGLRDDDVYFMDINSSGLIAGLGYPVTGGGNAEDERPFVIDAVTGETTLLPVPDGWEGAGLMGINEAGQVSGSVARETQIRVKRKLTTVRERAWVIWNADLTIAAMSAATTEFASLDFGLSEAGMVSGTWAGATVVWDGTDGGTPQILDRGDFDSVGEVRVRPDGGLVGEAGFQGVGVGDRILEWSSPTSAPSILANRDLSMHGWSALLGESGVSFALGPDNEPWCVSPTGSVTRLAVPADSEGGRVLVETQGLAFGTVSYPDPDASPGSHGTIAFAYVWDVSGGC